MGTELVRRVTQTTKIKSGKTNSKCTGKATSALISCIKQKRGKKKHKEIFEMAVYTLNATLNCIVFK